VLANGVGGYEGGPPWFNVAELCGVGGAGGSQSGLQCDGRGSCGNAKTTSGVSGLVLEPGGGAGVTVGGKYVMTP